MPGNGASMPIGSPQGVWSIPVVGVLLTLAVVVVVARVGGRLLGMRLGWGRALAAGWLGLILGILTVRAVNGRHPHGPQNLQWLPVLFAPLIATMLIAVLMELLSRPGRFAALEGRLRHGPVPGMGLLEHATEAITAVLGDRGSLLFVPFASSDPDTYTSVMRQVLARAGIEVTGLHQASDPPRRWPTRTRCSWAAATRSGCCAPSPPLACWTGCGRRRRPASRTWPLAPGPIWPARRSAPPTTCRSSSRARWRRSG